MKSLMLALIVSGVAVIAVQAAGQGPNATVQAMHLEMNMPQGGSVQLSALSMTRDESSSVIRLTGEAEIRVRSVPLQYPAPYLTVLRADELYFHLDTGEIIEARGDIRVAIEEDQVVR